MTRWCFKVPVGRRERLDSFLAAELGVLRRRLRSALDPAHVTVNGRQARKGTTVATGDLILVENPGELEPSASPNPQLHLKVIYEDDDLVAVDKPPGLPCVAIRPLEQGTVASALLALYPGNCGLPKGSREAGLVHRLDTGTSGLLLAARTPDAYSHLRAAFTDGLVRKAYLALVHGRLERAGVISLPLAGQERSARKMVVWRQRSNKPRLEAHTRYRPVFHTAQGTLVAVTITTGVRHQIRCHLAAINHPVVGDMLYGGASCECQDRRPHLFLHARRLLVPHPRRGTTICITTPPPASWTDLLGKGWTKE